MKKKIVTLLFISSIALSTLCAAENLNEHYIEHADIVVNVDKIDGTGHMQGYLLAKACDGCKQVRIEIDSATEIFLNGRRTDAGALVLKIDWQGMVFFSDKTPKTATRLMLQ
jgi:hypothetical protein